ncbi:MAG: hypothetical protein IT373_11135 [Polyangiaceae bacterium]|nr:hypothetical protein [Polyangiaceae bacterium]
MIGPRLLARCALGLLALAACGPAGARAPSGGVHGAAPVLEVGAPAGSAASGPTEVVPPPASAAARAPTVVPGAVLPDAMAWYGTVGGRRVAVSMQKLGDAVTFRSVDAEPPFTLEGTLRGDELSVHETTATGTLAGAVTARLEATDATRELAVLFADRDALWLVEDLAPAAGLRVARRRIDRSEPGLEVHTEYLELPDKEFATLDLWLQETAHYHEPEVEAGARELVNEARRVNPAVDPRDVRGAGLEVTTELAYAGRRYVSVLQEQSVYTGSGAHPMNNTWCRTWDRRTGKMLGMADLFAVADIRDAVRAGLGGLAGIAEVDPSDADIARATEPDARVCLTRRGVWLYFDLAHAVHALDGIAVPYERLAGVLRPGIVP